jgi:hypothetical protein
MTDPMTDWVTRAARAMIKRKAEAIITAACELADFRNREVSQEEMIAAALREAVNQCQNSMGCIYAPDLLCIARHMEKGDG